MSKEINIKFRRLFPLCEESQKTLMPEEESVQNYGF